MKRLTKLKIKYILIVACLSIFFLIPTFMRYYISVTADVVGYAKEANIYIIKFHSNNGVGTMEDIIMNYNVSKKLSKNIFTYENCNFIGWNTKADGSGISYVDEQEINYTTEIPENELNLYAQWTNNSVYTVEYNANDGTGNMQAQIFEYGIAQKLKANTFTKEDQVFWHWNTKADGTGICYENEEEVSNLTNINGGKVTLYAIYAAESYINNNDIVFDGTNYINTGVYLFCKENINRDFEISFEIKERGSNSKLNTMMSAMDESGSPWPGIVYRVNDASNDQYVANTTTTKLEKTYRKANAQKVTFKRICNILYIQFNDEAMIQIADFSLLTTPFNIPLTFGASLDENLNPFRYFTGTLSNLKVVFTNFEVGTIRFDKNGGTGNDLSQIIKPNTNVTLTKNNYTRTGYEFDCWNTKADGTGIRYENQESVTNIVNAGETITLYAQWKKFGYTVKFNANGGTGSMETQGFESEKAQKLNASTFTKEGYSFGFWNTKADGSGKSYEDEEEVKNLATTNGAIVNLYAIYEKYNYVHEGDILFNGTNYINTNIYLFSKKNVNKDFEMSFEIKECASTTSLATIMSAMDESGSPYPGIVFRMDKDGNNYQLETNAIKGPEKSSNFTLDSITNVIFKRVSSVFYMKINDDEEQQIIDFSTLKKLFYSPLAFGASLNGSLKPQRYFNGTLSNIRVTLYQ